MGKAVLRKGVLQGRSQPKILGGGKIYYAGLCLVINLTFFGNANDFGKN